MSEFGKIEISHPEMINQKDNGNKVFSNSDVVFSAQYFRAVLKNLLFLKKIIKNQKKKKWWINILLDDLDLKMLFLEIIIFFWIFLRLSFFEIGRTKSAAVVFALNFCFIILVIFSTKLFAILHVLALLCFYSQA